MTTLLIQAIDGGFSVTIQRAGEADDVQVLTNGLIAEITISDIVEFRLDNPSEEG